MGEKARDGHPFGEKLQETECIQPGQKDDAVWNRVHVTV